MMIRTNSITLLDAKNMRTVLNRADVDELQESPISIILKKCSMN